MGQILSIIIRADQGRWRPLGRPLVPENLEIVFLVELASKGVTVLIPPLLERGPLVVTLLSNRNEKNKVTTQLRTLIRLCQIRYTAVGFEYSTLATPE